MTDSPRIVAHGRSMSVLPPSRAPLLFVIGLVLVIVAAVLGGTMALSLIVAFVGLAAFSAGAFAAWLRLTDTGRVIMALPIAAWVFAFSALGLRIDPLLVQVLAVVAVGLSLFAFVALIRPMGSLSGVGARRGSIEGSFVRTLNDDGIAECRIDDAGITVHVASGEPTSFPFAELAPARLEERGGRCDLVIDDIYGDSVLRLRAKTANERVGMKAVADAITRHSPKQQGK